MFNADSNTDSNLFESSGGGDGVSEGIVHPRDHSVTRPLPPRKLHLPVVTKHAPAWDALGKVKRHQFEHRTAGVGGVLPEWVWLHLDAFRGGRVLTDLHIKGKNCISYGRVKILNSSFPPSLPPSLPGSDLYLRGLFYCPIVWRGLCQVLYITQ